MMLLQKLFFLSLFVSMIISPNGLKDRFRRLLRKEPSSKDVKPEEKVYEDSAPSEILNDLIEKYHPKRETVQQGTSSKSGAIAMVGHMSPFQEVSHNPLGGRDKYQLRQEQKERYNKYKTNEPQEDLYEKDLGELKEHHLQVAKSQQSQIKFKRFFFGSESEIDELFKDVDTEYMDDNELFVLRITDIDGKFEKYKRENQDRPILGPALKKYISYQNAKGHPLERIYDDRLIMVYAFLEDILSDAERVMLGPYEEDRKILYHISIDECERIQSDIDRNSCYELLFALKKHGIPAFVSTLWNIEEMA